MTFAGALSVLRLTLPSYLALTRRGLPRLEPDGFELHPSLAAPPLALEVALAMLALPCWSTPICSWECPATPGRLTESEVEQAAELATAPPAV
jgi:hypothetical protein